MPPCWPWAIFRPTSTSSRGYFGNPWDPGATAELDSGRPVLLIGTGLTMIDVTLDLLEKGFTGPIIALSRRGLLPQPHAAGRPGTDSPRCRRSTLALHPGARRAP